MIFTQNGGRGKGLSRSSTVTARLFTRFLGHPPRSQMNPTNLLKTNTLPKTLRNPINLMKQSLTSMTSSPPLAFVSYDPQDGFLSVLQRHHRSAEFGDAHNLAIATMKLPPLVVPPEQRGIRSLTVTMKNTRMRSRMRPMISGLLQRRRGHAPKLLAPHMVASAR